MPIPSFIMKGGYYKVKIKNIYDPSKFWIIIKFRELNIFVNYLKYFYNNGANRKNILRSDIKKNLMCVVSKNGMYYRSVILPILLPEKDHLRVFMIDFGYIVNVHIDDLFYIHEKHKEVPRFAIRASLAYLSAVGPAKTWSQIAFKSFCEVVEGEGTFAKVFEIDYDRCILFIDIYNISEVKTISVSNTLINSALAEYNKSYKSTRTEQTKYKCKVKYPHLFPSFESLESGAVPLSLWEKDLLKYSVPLDLLYKNYYEYQDINTLKS